MREQAMQCEEARPLISAGLDGEIQDPLAAGLRDHLAACERCQTERAALAGTVRLLQTLPEADPPAELRRRIGVALLEEERRAQRRRLGWAWLARPQTAGWAWGAATGAMLAAIALVNLHGGARPPRRVVASHPVSRSASQVAVPPPSPSAVKPTEVRKPLKHATAQPAEPAPKTDEPRLDAQLPSAQVPSPEAPPPLPVERTQAARPVSSSRSHATGHPRRGVRISPPISASQALARGVTPKEDKTAPRPISSDGDGPRTAWMNSQPARTSPDADPLDSEESSNTDGMTQMAFSTPMSAPPEEEKDDLAELRHRLTDRPLQAPELGQLKPTDSRAARRDGWIRF